MLPARSAPLNTLLCSMYEFTIASAALAAATPADVSRRRNPPAATRARGAHWPSVRVFHFPLSQRHINGLCDLTVRRGPLQATKEASKRTLNPADANSPALQSPSRAGHGRAFTRAPRARATRHAQKRARAENGVAAARQRQAWDPGHGAPRHHHGQARPPHRRELPGCFGAWTRTDAAPRLPRRSSDAAASLRDTKGGPPQPWPTRCSPSSCRSRWRC
jgi:hypothetical protein